MKTINKIAGLLTLTLVLVSFSQCSSAQKLQKNAPTAFGETYYEQWVSGVAGGPSGINVFIELKNESLQLDSIYFRGKVSKFEVKPSNKLLFIGRFINETKDKTDMIISSNTNEEYGNKAIELPLKIPFELENDECVVSYKINGKTKYYKIANLIKKQSLDIPMSPASNNN
ncbi:MAG: hypothetical protein DA407_09325 [Bacteroidetes bacterium]|nr:MAG: hypothetical protein DA407_09325 [Bacteroidota bacterium]